ncbi:MAG: site-specific DNA-methyltransferase [archaeon]
MGITGIYFHTAEKMPEIPDGTVQLCFASNPYSGRPDGKLDKEEYLAFLGTVYSECFRTLKPGGIFVTLNTDLRDHAKYNRGDRRFDGRLWRKHNDIALVAEDLGLRHFWTVIWQKTAGIPEVKYFDGRIIGYSYVQFFCKDRLPPGGNPLEEHPDVWPLEDAMIRVDSNGYEFTEAIHPEIPRRCIRLFTKEGDVVLAPFTGSGTVQAAAHELNRNWVGYETNKNLERLISESIFGPIRPDIYKA